MNTLKSQLTSLIGIGAFTYLSLSSFYILIKGILRELLIILKTDNAINFWTTEIAVLALFVVTSFLTVKFLVSVIENSEHKVRKLFILLVVAFFVIQILQFLHSYFGTSYVIENHNEKFIAFYDYLRENHIFGFYGSLFGTSKYILFGIIILMERKRSATSSALPTNLSSIII